LISHEYESIADPRRSPRLTNGDRINPVSHFVCDINRRFRDSQRNRITTASI